MSHTGALADPGTKKLQAPAPVHSAAWPAI